MRGFEERHTDIVDCIVGITATIWEDQDVGYVHDTHGSGARLHVGEGWCFGVEGVVEAAVGSVTASPDAQLLADDVLWAGDEDTGFITSHRAVITGHHTVPWRWGPPTGGPLST